MGLSASQGRLLLLTARKDDLEFRAQQISQRRLILSQQLEEISQDYEDATSNRQMKIGLYLDGANSDSVYNRKESNLTYAALISGTLSSSLGASALETGIKAYERTADQEFRSNKAYRLVNASGAIVISDKNEIPTGINQIINIKTKKLSSSTVTSTSTNDDGDETSTTDSVQEEVKTALYDCISNENHKNVKMYYDKINGTIKVTYDGSENGEVFDVNGDKVNSNKYKQGSSVSYDIKDNAISFETSTNYSIKEGSDNQYSLIDEYGAVLFRYVVDESLKYGTTDSAGGESGPNYLQDCLRNGKYLIQKGGYDDNDEGKFKWRSVSWDATANISDYYYDEDDDAAKAKYDRMQAQIQNQDKKLEIELNNIETERSAVTTEIESVQKVIDDNVQDSFKVFNA